MVYKMGNGHAGTQMVIRQRKATIKMERGMVNGMDGIALIKRITVVFMKMVNVREHIVNGIQKGKK